MANVTTAPKLIEPEKFGKYVITVKLGTGGMAEVFLCKLPGIGGFDKLVVVKRILPDLIEDSNFLDMFLDEARIAANLTHPNIAQVFEIDHVDQVPYIAMEYVRGPTLSRIFKAARKNRAMHLGHLSKIIADAAKGLDYAHNARDSEGEPLQLVHRDVTPQNILVTFDGIAKLVDFGVARARGRLAVTREGTIKGKLRYMSPEQLKQGSYDGRADVFSLGVCLYYGATGRHPFDGDNEIDVMKAVLAGDFPAPSSLVDGFPPQLETILQAALHPDPGQRTPNAHAFHEQLEDFVRTGEYASSHKALSAWLTGLFPDFDSALARQPVTPPLSGPGSVSNSEVFLSPSGTPISKQYRRFTPANRTALSPGIDIPVEVRADPTPAWKTLGMGAAGAVVVMLSLAAVLGRWGSSAKVTPVPAPVAVSAPVNPPVNAPAASPPSPAAEVATAAASIEAPDPTPTSTTVTTPAAARPAGRSPAGSWRSPQATTKSAPPSPAHGQTAPSPPAAPAPTPTWTPDSPLPPP